jgi:general secretion pathway protein I
VGLNARRQSGFTLIEVMVALAVVAIALAAGARASGALSLTSERQTEVLLAQLCAENELVKVRLARQMPNVGDSAFSCEQAGRSFGGRLSVQATPNPNMRKVDAKVLASEQEGAAVVLQVSTVVGRF